MEEMTIITAIIAGRPYPLKIKAGDESLIREIVKEINDKIRLFQTTYTEKDKQDHLVMVLLTYAVELFKAKQQSDTTVLSNRLHNLDKLLSQAVND